MKSFFSFILLLFFLLIPLFPHSTAIADTKKEANISDIIITTSETDLLLFCTVKNSFTPEMIEGIRNGIPITFTFLIKLDKVNNNWFDTTLADLTLQHTLTYDTLKEQYRVQLSERSQQMITTNSIDKAKKIMAELSGIKIIAHNQLTPDTPYVIRVKAKLAEKTLPFNMHYIIPFISLWDFETDWRTIEFRY